MRSHECLLGRVERRREHVQHGKLRGVHELVDIGQRLAHGSPPASESRTRASTSRSTSFRFFRAASRSAEVARRSMSRRAPLAASCSMATASVENSSCSQPARASTPALRSRSAPRSRPRRVFALGATATRSPRRPSRGGRTPTRDVQSRLRCPEQRRIRSGPAHSPLQQFSRISNVLSQLPRVERLSLQPSLRHRPLELRCLSAGRCPRGNSRLRRNRRTIEARASAKPTERPTASPPSALRVGGRCRARYLRSMPWAEDWTSPRVVGRCNGCSLPAGGCRSMKMSEGEQHDRDQTRSRGR